MFTWDMLNNTACGHYRVDQGSSIILGALPTLYAIEAIPYLNSCAKISTQGQALCM